MMVSSASGVLRRRPEKVRRDPTWGNISTSAAFLLFSVRWSENWTHPQQAHGCPSIRCRLLTRVQWSQRFSSVGPVVVKTYEGGSEQKRVLSPSVPWRCSKYHRYSVKMTHLVQEERAVTRHPSSVVHDRRDVADKTNTGFTDLVVLIINSVWWEVRRDTHSPLASSSQISKNTMRSYLLWQGPTCGRVIAVSLVAGTVLEEETECQTETRLAANSRELL